jgi:predicted nucleic acid-binding protein
MSFLLDTNVISEWMKPAPNPNVTRWLDEVNDGQVFLSVASLAEIRHGVELMDPGGRRDRPLLRMRRRGKRLRGEASRDVLVFAILLLPRGRCRY